MDSHGFFFFFFGGGGGGGVGMKEGFGWAGSLMVGLRASARIKTAAFSVGGIFYAGVYICEADGYMRDGK
jgi:hypothetical protein